eukprot:TRINITY_DN2234_c0_g1_i1.p1 TRINITY_DN2234_c0_g1~~TRINITY_DN2234_c0_g1_i1.p1  ORF type:complete len:153 (+),score=16.75 TRINITY_DN2234_c0_g1_i1:48-506(+)
MEEEGPDLRETLAQNLKEALRAPDAHLYIWSILLLLIILYFLWKKMEDFLESRSRSSTGLSYGRDRLQQIEDERRQAREKMQQELQERAKIALKEQEEKEKERLQNATSQKKPSNKSLPHTTKPDSNPLFNSGMGACYRPSNPFRRGGGGGG